MNNVITSNINGFLNHNFITCINGFTKIGYKVCFISFGNSMYSSIDANDNMYFKYYSSAPDFILQDNTQKELIDYLTIKKFDFIFTDFTSVNIIKIFNKINGSEIFYKLRDSEDIPKFFDINNCNIINFDLISYDSFILKYMRHKKLKNILNNE